MAFQPDAGYDKSLPPLAWVMTLDRGDPAARIMAGTAVELVGDGLVAGAWSRPFAEGGMATALTSIGTGIRPGDELLTVICGNACADVVYAHRLDYRMVVGNLLPLVLAVAGDRPLRDYAFYSNDMFMIYLGAARYRPDFPMQRGQVSLIYNSFSIDANLDIRRLPLPLAPPFPDFAAYKSFLTQQTGAVFANAADPARKVRYRPLAAVSSGYDAPGSAVIARDAGCTESFTFRQSTVSKGEDDDSGEAVARELGLRVSAFDTFAYRERSDSPEIVFAAAGFGGGQAYHAGHEDFFRGRLVVGGGGGDTVWGRSFRLDGLQDIPFYLGGYSGTKGFLGLPALKLDVPAIGVTSYADIGRISCSPEMQPWSIGGSYDRPIARRLVEEAGGSRGNFGRSKLRVALGYERPHPKFDPLENYLSPRSLADFQRWYEGSKPASGLKTTLHNLKIATVGKIVWSKKVARALRKLGITWPPDRTRAWRLLVPVRSNAFVFQWAMEREIAKYQQLLGKQSAS